MLKIFSVFDSKVGAYLNPLFMRSNGEAIRAFASAACSPDHEFHKYAGDFTLFELGAWHPDTATVSMLPTPKSLGVAIEFVNRDDAVVPLNKVVSE